MTARSVAGKNPKHNFDVFVGKDVLELLGGAMYVNPLSVIRECVQNAVDGIDDAVAGGMLKDRAAGIVNIDTDLAERRLVIRDNGMGVSNRNFARTMLSLGASRKRGTAARGFRGVGRLAGLGFAQRMVFRSRSCGDKRVKEAVWDAITIKRLLASDDQNMDLAEIVRNAVAIQNLDPDGYPEHFFEVEILKPRRTSNDPLLNESLIKEYVSQVCPCPFSPDFPFADEISEKLNLFGGAGNSYRIFLNGGDVAIFRPYLGRIEYGPGKSSEIDHPKFFEIAGLNGNIAAVCWIVHHEYLGAIPAVRGVRGFRARVGNIQVGDEKLLSSVFREERFSSWSLGEVHIFDQNVIPNGRRDDFEFNGHMDNILLHLSPIADEVVRNCRVKSQKRNRMKSFDSLESKVLSDLDVLNQGVVSRAHGKSIVRRIDRAMSKLEEVMDFNLFSMSDTAEMKIRHEVLGAAIDEFMTKPKSDVIDSFSNGKKAAYRQIIDLIYEESCNQVVAKALVDRILDRLKTNS